MIVKGMDSGLLSLVIPACGKRNVPRWLQPEAACDGWGDSAACGGAESRTEEGAEDERRGNGEKWMDQGISCN